MRGPLTPSQPRGQSRHRSGQCSSAMPSSSSDDAALPAERMRAPAAASLEEAAQSIASELSQLTSTSSLANQTGGIARVECPLALEALPDGVATVPSILRSFSSRYAVYFARRSQSASSDSFVSTAGFGVARLWSGCAGASVSSVWPSIRRFVRSLDGLMALGGGRFDFERDPSAEWSDFGSFTFFVPLLEVTEHPDCIVLACNAVWKPAGPTRQWVESGPDELCSVISDALALLQILITSGPFSAIRTPLRLAALPEVENDRRRSSEKHEPFAHTEWEQQVHGILSEIESDKLRKAVLARQKRLQLRSKHRKRERRRGLDASHWRQKDGYDTIALMSSLRKRERESYSFALELPSGTAFFGCTPEQLLCLSGSTVTSEALAGTRPRTVGREDNELESDLNESAKELQEHAIVRSGIMDAFEDVCEEDSVVSHGRSVRKLRRIQHLYCTISGRIREGTSGEARLLDSLHPTAAVCGSPRVHALNVIRNHEQFDRGLYSGPIGYLSSDGAEITVGIRSGLLLPDHESVFLYGGVGIVHGADASAEWNETELKIGQLESALQAPPDIDAQPNAQMLWASLAIEELWRCGARDICIAPGSRSAPLALAASRHSHLRVHYCIDERTLGFYALGLAKGTYCTRPIVVITSSGTAVANLLPSAVEAEQSKVPLIFLTADRPPEMQNCGANQTIKQDGIFSTCARFQVTIPGPTDKIPSRFVLTSIDEAFSKALSPQSGPVHVNFELREPLFPTEQADSTRDTLCDLSESWMRSRWPFTSIASQNELLKYAAEVRIPQDILHLLLSAEAGLIICTGLSGQEDVIAAARLASHLGWPLIADVSASAPLDSVARSNWLGSLSLVLSSSKVQDAIGSPDVILQLGVRVTSRSTFAYMERFAADRVSTQWIVVDQSLSRHDPAHHVSHRIELSPSRFAPAVLDALSRSGCDTTSALLDLAYTAADITKEALQASAPALRPSLTDIDVVHHVISTLPASSILFCGNSLSIRDLDVCAVLDMDSDSTLRRESNRGASGIDGLLSTALGIAHSSGRALTAVVGDVSFHHDLNSLRLFQSGHMPAEPVTLVVLSNGGGKVFSELPLAQNVTSEELAQVFETAPSGSIAAMCGAFGIDHQLVRSNHELHPALFHSWSLNSHSVVEIDVSSAAERYPDARKRLRHVATDAVCRRLATQHTCRPWSSSKRVGDVAWCRRSTGDAVLVRLELANSGCAGWGEAAPHNMFSRESCDDIEVQLKRIEKGLTTAHVTSRILGLASGYDAWLETCLGRGQALQLVPSLRFAIETALLSALASEAGLGLHSLLLPETMSASPASAHVLCNSLLTAESDPELRTPLMGDSDVMKIKVGDLGDPEADAERVIRARNAAGANCRIRCDANRQYTYEQALTFMQRIASLENLDYVEEPVDGDGATMGALKARSGVRIAVDESMLEAYREHQDVSGIFSSDAVNVADAFVVKPSAYGSISTCMSLCYAAAMADRQLVVTGAAESSIGLSSVACIAALADATVGRREAHGLSILDDSLLESDTALTMESRAIPRRGDAGELRMNLAAVAQNMQDGSKQSGGNYAYE